MFFCYTYILHLQRSKTRCSIRYDGNEGASSHVRVNGIAIPHSTGLPMPASVGTSTPPDKLENLIIKFSSEDDALSVDMYVCLGDTHILRFPSAMLRV